MEIYKNDYFCLTDEDHDLWIDVYVPGFDIRDFDNIIAKIPTLQLTNFVTLKKALAIPPEEPVCIGKVKPPIEVIIAKNELEARIKINMTKKEMEQKGKNLSSDIITALNENGVTEGILSEVIYGPLQVQKEIVVAKGTLPTEGNSSRITYYKLSSKKPVIKKDGRVDHYELNLIDNVKKGEWLGEKIPPTEGNPGKTVTGKVIPARKGRDFPLKYDPKTVEEVEENGHLVLRARIDGAVKWEDDKIKVDNHLIINGDIDFDTGNINFEGSVTIMGTVNDGFSVTAKNDISIQSEMGIGAIKKIESLEGSIYVKGGIFGKNVAKIQAKKDVFIKYCNECSITAGENIHIGFYSLDSTLNAKNVYFDPDNGKIMGGEVCADIQVIAGVVGNQMEKKTSIHVRGFDRLAIKAEFDRVLDDYRMMLTQAGKMKRQLEIYENNLEGAEYGSLTEYNEYLKKYLDILDRIRNIDEQRKKLQKILETRGEGEVAIFKAAYPQTVLKIKQMEKRIRTIVRGNFFVVDRTLHHD